MRTETRLTVHAKYGGRCAYCGEYVEFEKMQVDHIRPKLLGGVDDLNNYNPSCASCNNRKQTLSIEEFRAELEAQPQRLRRDRAAFRIAERFGLVTVTGNPVIFYFEQREAGKS